MRFTVMSKEEKSLIRKNKLKSQFDLEVEWHKKFAWLPRKISDKEYIWLETVERRLDYPYNMAYDLGWSWVLESWCWSLRSYVYREKQ